MKAQGNTCDTRDYSDRYRSLFIRQNIDSLSEFRPIVSSKTRIPLTAGTRSFPPE